MESNLNLTIGYKGQLELKAVAVPLQEGYLKIGGFADNAVGAAALPFGIVVSADPANPNVFEAGVPSGNVIRGICVYDDAIAQNAIAHPNSYLPGMPAAAIRHGFIWFDGWTTTATGAGAPAIGGVVIFNDTTGVIEFMAAGSTAPTGWTALAAATIVDVDPDNGALIYIQ